MQTLQKQLPTGEWVMYAGNAIDTGETNEDIKGDDKTAWSLLNGNFYIYTPEDFNLDGDINGADKVLWEQNNGTFNNLPE